MGNARPCAFSLAVAISTLAPILWSSVGPGADGHRDAEGQSTVGPPSEYDPSHSLALSGTAADSHRSDRKEGPLP
jgi:hypothetical protein